ncbi:glutathione S-transferase family protein [Parasphingorhabdus cellanae]|uniref:Glutathione S-transferase family protein n=1 Tax=Parasphingorhabdus cellanae TaxID=2806553 RepID=A0ABX7T7B2_9SPHN|nr:glutathione S-transferase family protein [Parasphingorhabdus cellanae]QTD56793.1 glutathione S-transferase family protein [Parasphingorhabdus cellanae]
MALSSSTLTFYTNPMSRGQIARWALHEAGADYDQKIVQYGEEIKSADYLAINPMGKVPAIVHNGKTVTECAAICAYLADAFLGAGLAPTPDEQADYYRWLFFAAGPVEQAVMDRNLGLSPTTEQERSAGYGSYDRAMDVLDQMLQSNQYVCGDRFTMADVYVGSQVDWGLQFQTFPERDSFTAYAERLREREKYKESKAIDAALMPES